MGPLSVAFTLPRAEPATLELLDIAGRQVVAREVGSLGPGSHLIRLGECGCTPPGMYWLRLSQAGRSLVKRAVASNQAVSPAARPQAEVRPAPKAALRDHDPQWFKVRVVDKATGKRKVTVNLPLAVVKALGDDMPIDWPCGGRESRVRSTIKLSEVLSALEAGQDLVQVDDDDSEVRVWVE